MDRRYRGREENMTTINIKGLKKAASATKGLTGRYGKMSVQMIYDRATGELSTHEFVGHNSWIDLSDRPECVNVGNFCEPATMSEIAERVETAVAQHDALAALA
jgi:hypothetical protein